MASSRSSRSAITDRAAAAAAGKASSRALKSVRGGRKKQIIETESEEEDMKAVKTLEVDESKLPSPPVPQAPATKKKAAAPARRGRKKKNTAPESSGHEEEISDGKQPPDQPSVPSTPSRRRTGRTATISSSASVEMGNSPVTSSRRVAIPAAPVEGSPAPVSKRGRRRKVNSDVKEFLKEAKQELETKTGRGRRKVKEEPVQEEQHGDLKSTGGRELRKQEDKVSPEPVITVGRGKRKKVRVICYFLILIFIVECSA